MVLIIHYNYIFIAGKYTQRLKYNKRALLVQATTSVSAMGIPQMLNRDRCVQF